MGPVVAAARVRAHLPSWLQAPAHAQPEELRAA